jgi:hypothetical protein
MNFLDLDLGWNESGSIVLVTLEGVESDVMLVSSSDVSRFKSGQRISYWGGHYKRSPARLRVPSSGHWHVLVVPGPGGRVRAAARVLQPV